MAMITRLATLRDAPAIARIHNQGIEERIATFETEPRSTAEIDREGGPLPDDCRRTRWRRAGLGRGRAVPGTECVRRRRSTP